MIAIDDAPEAGKVISLDKISGAFTVTPNKTKSIDFRTRGKIVVKNQRFMFAGAENGYWLKAGADSPENLLAYEGFDNTYRMAASDDDGEAKTDGQIHRFAAHSKDFAEGDPTWVPDLGKTLLPHGITLVGAINYLSSKGMNSVYFLTNNIGGDGKDVWPYLKPDDFTRFDCSKLCLLYTSPSPRDATLSRMPSSA